MVEGHFSGVCQKCRSVGADGGTRTRTGIHKRILSLSGKRSCKLPTLPQATTRQAGLRPVLDVGHSQNACAIPEAFTHKLHGGTADRGGIKWPRTRGLIVTSFDALRLAKRPCLFHPTRQAAHWSPIATGYILAVRTTAHTAKPYSPKSFGQRFRKWCDEAGRDNCTAHGLRKAAARRFAEAGCSNQQIKSWTGQTTARYTAAADQETLSEAAAEMLIANLRERLANDQPDPLGKET